jgi:hypothetical protein
MLQSMRIKLTHSRTTLLCLLFAIAMAVSASTQAKHIHIRSKPFGAREGVRNTIPDIGLVQKPPVSPVAGSAGSETKCSPRESQVGATGQAMSLLLWPLPRVVNSNGEKGTLGISPHFSFKMIQGPEEPRTAAFLHSAFTRSCARLVANAGAQTIIHSLEIKIARASSFPPQYGKMDESYNLTIVEAAASSGPVAQLVANTQYGALRGLETFSQLFDQAGGASVAAGLPVTIEDWP